MKRYAVPDKPSSDFTVAAFIVKDKAVLRCKHKKMGMWRPIGGNVDPGEDPEHGYIGLKRSIY